MKALQLANAAYEGWLETVSRVAVQKVEAWSSASVLRLIEVRRGEFAFNNAPDAEAETFRLSESATPTASGAERMRGSRIELVLMPDQAVVRPMILPSKAGEFIDGIVRAQIDRIAPWNAEQAIYGWKLSPGSQSGQISLVIAVASRGLIKPYLSALESFGARSIMVRIAVPDETAGPITIFETQFNRAFTANRVRDGLSRALKVAATTAVFALGLGALIDVWLDRERADLTQRTAILQKSARAVPAHESIQGAAQVLHRKKTSAAVTMIIEGLSQILPDQTYVTELRWDAEKLRLTGITKDAAELINLLEKSGLFMQASFFAPTMRTDAGERYHIQVTARPRSVMRT